MSYQEIQSEIFKKIRGDESQLSLSRRMGFRSNQINKWESDQRQIKWNDFVKLCEFNKIPLEATIHFCLKILIKKFNYASASEVIRHFLLLYGFNNYQVVARRLRIHPSILQRWMTGKVEPDLESMLQIFDLVNDFVDHLLKRLFEGDPGYVNQTSSVNDSENLTQLEFVSHNPWALAIISSLELMQFANLKTDEIDKLSEFLGIGVIPLKRTIDLLVQLKILAVTTDQSYKLLRRDFNFSNLPVVDIVRPAHFWNDRIQARIGKRLQNKLKKTKGHAYFSDFRVMAVSANEIDQLNTAITEFVGKISTLVDRNLKDKENVSVLVLHHFEPGVLNPDSDQVKNWTETYKPN